VELQRAQHGEALRVGCLKNPVAWRRFCRAKQAAQEGPFADAMAPDAGLSPLRESLREGSGAASTPGSAQVRKNRF
jgi:hypothetical protein